MKHPRTKRHLTKRRPTKRRTTKCCLAKCRRGSITVEVGVALPMLITALLGGTEVIHFFFLSSTIENAVLHASRYGITGTTEPGLTRQDRVRQIVAHQTFGRVDMDHLTIDILVYDRFDDIGRAEPFLDENDSGSYEEGEPFTDVNGNGRWDPDMARLGLGGGGDVVLYRVSYPAESLTGFFDWALTDVRLQAAVAVRNEPF
ncbi:TadE/TadG family type IV pilus assembly protein [Eilatimonas milleporae]|uniref:TadE-like domain-containing protein n=1 Tax=Eilatimonas milleporae TaxID=911205 RepID=A0A3M0CSC6_9PROT|nr:TadE/TadG family type IV pilus assembly protein [Eilatimonas milleporae]RMB12491.1 hypothetical protein BXY39_0989 [Eilatimonas milleporae]